MAIEAELAKDTVLGSTIRFFLSSTFADFQTERTILQQRVFPELRLLCAGAGFRLQPIDLRWGVSEEAGTARQTLRICFDELEHCRQISPDFFLLIQLGDRYGSHILPPTVPATLVAQMLPLLAPDERRRFESAYRLDANALPAEYVLLRSEGPEQTGDELLRQALVRAGREAQLSDVERAPFEASATHREIRRGLLDQPADARRDEGVLCAVRRFRGQAQGPAMARFVESDNARANEVRQLADAVLGRLRLEQTLTYEVDWSGDAGPNLDEGTLAQAYLRLLRPKIEAVMAARTRARAQAKAQGLDAVAMANATFEAQRAARVRGRKEELDRLAAYVAGETGTRLPLVVTGAPGSGKSTLVAETAKRATLTHPHAVLITRYIGVTPGTGTLLELLNDLRAAIARAYGAEEPAPLTDLNALITACAAQLATLHAPPERPLILVVDSLDQLGPATERTDWLPSRLAPDVHVVVSVLRDRPEFTFLSARLPATQVLTLGPLPPTAGQAMLRDLLDEAPRRTLTGEQEATTLSAFAAEGLPLYIRLAASEARRWRSFDVPQLAGAPLPGTMVALLDAILQRLEAPERHGRVLVGQALGDLATARFGLAEDELLDLLARDGAVREAVRALSPNSPPIDDRLPLPVALWARLYAEIEPLLSEREMDGIRLYTFYHQQLGHAVARRYLAGGQKAEHHHALADYFAHQPWLLGQDHRDQWNWRKVRELVTQQEQAGDRASAEQTLGELLTVLEQAEVDGLAPTGTIKVVDALGDRLSIGGHWRLGQRFYEVTRSAHHRLNDRVGEGTALFNMGILADGLGQKEQARSYFEQALAIMREVGHRATEGIALMALARQLAEAGQREAAHDQYVQALEIFGETGDRAKEGQVLLNLGALASRQGRPQQAREFYLQALDILREAGNRSHEGATLQSLGATAADLGEPEQAHRYYEEALGIFREIGDRVGEGAVLNNIGTLAEQQGQMDEARRVYEQALAIQREIGYKTHAGRTLLNLGKLEDDLGEVENARRLYEEALTIVREVGDRIAEGRILLNLGIVAAKLDTLDDARETLDRALVVQREVHDRVAEGRSLQTLGQIAARLGQTGLARQLSEQAVDIQRETEDRDGEAETLRDLGGLAATSRQMVQARSYYDQALAIYEAIGQVHDAQEVRLRIAALAPPRRSWWPFRKWDR